MTGEHRRRSVGSSTRCGQREQVRMVLGERAARTGRGGQRADGQAAVGVRRMTEQQPQDLAARIPAGTGHRHRGHAMRFCMVMQQMQIHSSAARTAPTRSAASATAASRAALASSSVSVRSGARNRSASVSDFAVLADLRAGVHVEQLDVLEQFARRPRARRRPRPGPATSSATTRLTSWNTAGNGDTAGAGSVSTIGTASRFELDRAGALRQAGPLDHRGMQLAGVARPQFARPAPRRSGPGATAGTARPAA